MATAGSQGLVVNGERALAFVLLNFPTLDEKALSPEDSQANLMNLDLWTTLLPNSIVSGDSGGSGSLS